MATQAAIPLAYTNTEKQLRALHDEAQGLLAKTSYLETKLEAQKRDFIQTRESGTGTGDVAPSLFPTIQDLAIYTFWISYIVLFYIIGTSKAFLEGAVSRYLFIGVTLAAFGLNFYNWKLAAGILGAAGVYYLLRSMKNFLFFLVFITMSIFIHAVIYNFF